MIESKKEELVDFEDRFNAMSHLGQALGLNEAAEILMTKSGRAWSRGDDKLASILRDILIKFSVMSKDYHYHAHKIDESIPL